MAAKVEPINDAKEMSRNQRNIVDTCFEEGQYEAGIALLDQLRSPVCRPSESHIRQLLYIALYPPAPEVNDKGKEKERLEPTTPGKANPARLQRSPLVPTVEAAEAAQRLLMRFARTNTPSVLFRALPECTSPGSYLHSPTNEEQDSYIAEEALCVSRSRSCWALLKEGFIVRKRIIPTTPRGKSKKRHRDLFEEDRSFSMVCDSTLPNVLAEHALPVLEWYVEIFRRDELLTEKAGQPRYSPILLSQIPAPRGGSGSRWEADAPLEVVFHCLQHTSPRMKTAGVSLLTSLMNLTAMVEFDMNLFVNLLYTRLTSSSDETLDAVFRELPAQPAVLRVKEALCIKFLSDSSHSKTVAQAATAKPKPQARALRAARRSQIDAPLDNVTPCSTTASTTSIESSVRKYTPVTEGDILRFMDTPSTPSDAQLHRKVKFELLLAHQALQAQLPAEVKDAERVEVMRLRETSQTLDGAFGGDAEGARFREVLDVTLPS